MDLYRIINLNTAKQKNETSYAANVRYVNEQVDERLPLDGSQWITGDLDMGGKRIKKLRPLVEDDSSQAASDAKINDVIDFKYFHTQRGELKRDIKFVASEVLN